MAGDFQEWIGREKARSDRIDAARSTALATFLSAHSISEADKTLAPLFHWIYFWDPKPPEKTGADGHPARGGFLPPVDAPLRMWASGKLHFHQNIRVGDEARRTSTIRHVKHKPGRSGDLTFVTVRHVICVDGKTCIEEEQVIVYRQKTAESAPVKDKTGAIEERRPDYRKNIRIDPVALFRYSALTLNSHRIHYDYPYATGEEGYSGLVVHGPLQATHLALFATSIGGSRLETFEFRAVAPAFCGDDIRLCAVRTETGLDLWSQQGDRITMTASASFSETGEAV